MACQLHQDCRACAVVINTVAEWNAVIVCAEGDVLCGLVGALHSQHNISGSALYIVLNQSKGHGLRLALYQLHCIDGTQNAARDGAVTGCPAAQLTLRQVGLVMDIRNISVPGQESCYTIANHPLVYFLVDSAAVDQNDHALFIVQIGFGALLDIGKASGQALCRCAARAAIALYFPIASQCVERYCVDIRSLHHKFFNLCLHAGLCQLFTDDVCRL